LSALLRERARTAGLLVTMAAAVIVAGASSSTERLQESPSSFSYFRQSDRKALLLFLDVQTSLRLSDDDGWRPTARNIPKKANKVLDQYDVATQTFVLSRQVLEMDRIIGEMLRDWERPDVRLLRYDTVWVVTDPLGGVLAREAVIRQPVIASRVRSISWYGAVDVAHRTDLAATTLLMDSPGDRQGESELSLDTYIERQTARWLRVAGPKQIDVHCANPKPVSSIDVGKLECRSMSIVLDPRSLTSPGGTAAVESWLTRLTRLPMSMLVAQAKPPTVYSRKLAAGEPLRVSCNSTSYAAPKIVLPDDVKGRIRSAYGLLEGATNILHGSVNVRSFTDREVFVVAELAGLRAGGDASAAGCQSGEARAVVLVTIEEGGGK
jgi:hypothetical protein